MPGTPTESQDEADQLPTRPAASRASHPSRVRWTASPLLSASIALVVISAVCAAWFGWSWLRAADSSALSLSRVRDQALQAGEQEIQNLNTLSYRTVHRDLAIWLASSTGRLHRYFAANEAAFTQDVIKTKAVTTASVLDAALTRLNAAAGTATIIAAVEVTVISPTGSPTIKTESEEGQLVRTPGGWKLSFLTIPPSGASSSSPVPGPAPGTGGTASPSPSSSPSRSRTPGQ